MDGGGDLGPAGVDRDRRGGFDLAADHREGHDAVLTGVGHRARDRADDLAVVVDVGPVGRHDRAGDLQAAEEPVDVAAGVDAPVVPDPPARDEDAQARISSEIGDVLFVVANIARRWQINPEEALRASNAKFERRVRYIEARLQEQGRELKSATLAEQEALYQDGKRRERQT